MDLEVSKTRLMTVLVTQSFGGETEYRRAIFTIWSAWANYRLDLPVLLFTDRPNFFQAYFGKQPVNYVLLTPQKIDQMRGEINFLHRMKIALIDEAFQLTRSDLMYVDSDTFFVDDPFDFIMKTQQGVVHMHLPEYSFAEIRDMPLPAAALAHAFLDLLETQTFTLANGNAIKIDPQLSSWNAGVMFLPVSVSSQLANVYALTDQFYPKTKNHASEQFAFSIILQMKAQLHRCDKAVYHYWYRVKKIIMDAWLNENINATWAALPVDKKIISVKKGTSVLPHYLESHHLSLRDDAIQAFHEKKFLKGYKKAFEALIKGPFQKKFFMDVLYHTKRLFYA
jgi:hypothetical protein